MGDPHVRGAVAVMTESFVETNDKYEEDGESVHHGWFINSRVRLGAFRPDKAAVQQVVGGLQGQEGKSVCSGILRHSGLAFSPPQETAGLRLVLPGNREKDAVLQSTRPSVKYTRLSIKRTVFDHLRVRCEAVCRLGRTHPVAKLIAGCRGNTSG